ncbi:MAG: TatD family hydrolase [Ignavibacteriae bacterium]|nr:TatD family hydrolase [Ignavibacteriota bacterium]
MIDTHAHIDAEQFDDDRAEMLERAWTAGVEAIVIPSIAPSGFDKLQSIVESDKRIYRGIGIHPHNANEATDVLLERVEKESKLERVVAIGEIGLDYYYDFAPKDLQKDVFRKQLNIAKRQELPVIIHNRDSDEDVLAILEDEQDGNLKFVLHCFSSSIDILNRALTLGAHISFTGNITYKNSTLAEVIARTPIERIMIETDSPYMTPVPNRGKRNEPSFVGLVAQKIAEIHSTPIDKVLSMTSITASKFFRLTLGIVLASIFSLSISGTALSQTSRDNRDNENEEEEMETEPVNPYARTFGFGLIMGTNTIVESIECLETGKRESRSYEGLLLYGLSLEYCLIDHLQFEASYIYSVNNKVVTDKIWPTPNVHQFVSLAARFVANPRKPVCFFATGGSSIILNRIFDQNTVQNSFNFGIGLYGNINTGFGLIVPIAELKFDFPFTSTQDPQEIKCGNSPADIGRFYSLVKFGVQWYPKF